MRYLADTLDWLNLWQDHDHDAGLDPGHDIGAEQQHQPNYPSPNL